MTNRVPNGMLHSVEFLDKSHLAAMQKLFMNLTKLTEEMKDNLTTLVSKTDRDVTHIVISTA